MRRGLLILLSALALTGTVWADDYGFLDGRHQAFKPLLADPRELQLSLRAVLPVSHKLFGEVAAGTYFSLYTAALGSSGSFFQWSMGGGIWSRLDLISTQKDLEVSDYNASMPFDFHYGRWSTRLLPFHVSSHLGDDYIKRTGILGSKYSFDAFKMLQSFEASDQWRFYAGYQYTLRWEHSELGRHMLQSGLEWTSRAWGDGRIQTFWATDFQNWERVHWNGMLHTQLGLHFRRDTRAVQTFSLYMEYAAGPREQGQFYDQKESHWGLGLRLALL